MIAEEVLGYHELSEMSNAGRVFLRAINLVKTLYINLGDFCFFFLFRKKS